MPGASPAGSQGGTGVSHCQQQAPEVGRFVFPLSFVLRVSPRTRLSSSSPGVFWVWIGQVYTSLMSRMIGTGRILSLHLQGLRLTSLKAEGKEGSCWHHSRVSSHTRLLTAQHPVRDRHFFFWVLALTNKSLGPAADSTRLPDLRQRAGFVLSPPCSQRPMLLPYAW